MADRPILFSAPMVRALLDGTKTQTRRLIKNMPQPFEVSPGQLCEVAPSQIEDESPARVRLGNVITTTKLPYGIGDRLWVREAHAILPRTAYRMSIGTGTIAQQEHPTDGYSAALFREGFDRSGRPNWRPSIHMPRWASRITLIVEDLRIQHLQEISEADAKAEGVEADSDGWRDYLMPATQCCGSARDSFASLWDSLNATRALWDSNPWVLAVSFTVERRNIEKVAA